MIMVNDAPFPARRARSALWYSIERFYAREVLVCRVGCAGEASVCKDAASRVDHALWAVVASYARRRACDCLNCHGRRPCRPSELRRLDPGNPAHFAFSVAGIVEGLNSGSACDSLRRPSSCSACSRDISERIVCSMRSPASGVRSPSFV